MNYKVYAGNIGIIWILFLFTVIVGVLTNDKWMKFTLSYFLLPIIPMAIIFIDMKLLKIKKIEWKGFSINRTGILALVIISFVSLPWLFSIVHVDISKIPLLNSIFLFPNHVGFQHGYEAWFAFVGIVLLFAVVHELKNTILKRVSLILLVALFLITAQNFVDDFFIEQVTPRFDIGSPFEGLHRRG